MSMQSNRFWDIFAEKRRERARIIADVLLLSAFTNRTHHASDFDETPIEELKALLWELTEQAWYDPSKLGVNPEEFSTVDETDDVDGVSVPATAGTALVLGGDNALADSGKSVDHHE